MKFAYQRYEVEASPAFGGGLLYRPEIPLRVIGQAGDANFLALVDTGADGTLIPRSLGERIGVEIDDSQAVPVRGFSGAGEVKVSPGLVSLELRQGETCYRWEATIGFVEFATPEAEQGILGHAGCLDFFVVTFDGETHELAVEPNGRFNGTVDQ